MKIKKLKKINPVGFLSVLSILAILAVFQEEKGWIGFLGYLYYIKYFMVNPDEGFWHTVKKSATVSFFAQYFALLPSIFLFGYVLKVKNYIPVAFGTSLSIGILVFTLLLGISEMRESIQMELDDLDDKE